MLIDKHADNLMLINVVHLNTQGLAQLNQRGHVKPSL